MPLNSSLRSRSNGGKGVEQELADVGEGHGVFAVDALEGELCKEIAEEAVHVLGGGKLTHGAKKELGARGTFAAMLFEILTVVVGQNGESGLTARMRQRLPVLLR
jgi:hypothetical protein